MYSSQARVLNISAAISGRTAPSGRPKSVREACWPRTDVLHRFLGDADEPSETALECDGRPRITKRRSAERIIVDPRRTTLTGRSLSDEELTSRWYVALVAIGSYYKRLSDKDLMRMTDDMRIPRLAADSEAVAAGNPPADLFASTTHVHSGRIMITG